MTALAPNTTWTDPTRRGSTAQQVAIGIAGMVFAVVLVVGQISVATTAGIAANLHSNIANMREGNATMAAITRKALPTIAMEKVVRRQQASLIHTNHTMVQLNEQMSQIGETTAELQGTVASMGEASSSLSSGVGRMNTSTTKMSGLLATLPGLTEKTGAQLSKIAGDSKAINAELATISTKMNNYGLPPAQNVGGRSR